jgi:transposase-like protein
LEERGSATPVKRAVSGEEIIRILRQIEVWCGQGKTVVEACREAGITDVTYYKWRKSYGGLQMDQARRLKELEAENARLRRAVADLTVDNQILKEVSKGKF